MDETQIHRMLERLGRALTEGDAKTAASCWEVPGLVLADQGAIVVSALDEVERFFASSVEAYRSRGIVTTKPDVERIEPLSEKLSAVDVRWPGFDAGGTERTSDRSHYIIRLGEDGLPRIRVALSRTL